MIRKGGDLMKDFFEEKIAEDYEDFSFLENELVVDKNENPVLVNNRELTFDDFLHGYCNVFALRLKNEYGYKLCNILDENRNLIHSYCVTDTGEFVDIRGKTTDIKMFFEEFDDWLDSGYPFDNPVSHEVYELSNTEKEIYAHTQNIIDNYSFYGN